MGKFSRLLLAAALTIPLLTAGCAAHRRGYASGPGEETHYEQWEHDTHRNHVDYDKRSKSDQKAYQKWRKQHQD